MISAANCKKRRLNLGNGTTGIHQEALPTEEKGGGEEEETEAATFAAMKPSLPPAPITPAVLHNPALSSRHLPSANPLVRFAESTSEKEQQAEAEQLQLQEEARATSTRAMAEWESQRDHGAGKDLTT